MSALAYLALWIFVFSVPWDWLLAVPGLAVIPRVTGGLALALTLGHVIMSGRLRRWQSFHVVAVLFWVWVGIELFIWHFGERLPYKFWTYAMLLLVLWIVWEVAPTERRLRGLLLAYVLGAYITAFETIRVFRMQAGALDRFAAGGADGNDLAMGLALGLPMAWYLGMTYQQPILRWVCRLYVPAALVTVGLTGSRGGMLATTVALLIVPLSMTRLSPGRLTTAIVILVGAGALAIAYTPETLIERLATTRTEIEGGRLGGRGKLWKAGLKVLPENPIFGVGTGRYKSAITPILGPASQVAHNSYLSVLVEQGVVGFVLYMSMLGTVLAAILRLPRLERRFALILLATLGIAMLPLTWEDRREVWLVLAILLGLSQAIVPGREAARAAVVRHPALGRVGRTLAGRGREWQPASRHHGARDGLA